MGEIKHTPGPWRLDLETDDYEIRIVGRPAWNCQRFGVKGEWDVCKVEPDTLDTDANARLIAAAPDLLAALEEIAAPLDGVPVGDPWAFYADLQQVARAAIVRARGEA